MLTLTTAVATYMFNKTLHQVLQITIMIECSDVRIIIHSSVR